MKLQIYVFSQSICPVSNSGDEFSGLILRYIDASKGTADSVVSDLFSDSNSNSTY